MATFTWHVSDLDSIPMESIGVMNSMFSGCGLVIASPAYFRSGEHVTCNLIGCFAVIADGSEVVAPGPIFSPKQQFRNFIRLNCGAPWSQTIDQALLKLGQLIARMM